jgi:hypothetical protein
MANVTWAKRLTVCKRDWAIIFELRGRIACIDYNKQFVNGEKRIFQFL